MSVLRPGPDPLQPWTATEIDRLPTSHRLRVADLFGDGHPVVVNAALLQYLDMFATQRNHQIGFSVLSTEQGSSMIRRHRVATVTQHRARLLIGAITDRSDSARTGHPHHISQATLPQLLSEQRRSHYRSSAIETAYKRDV